eukprot:CAMPEP_0173371742 /NCGR_PEP_ID=MMETSP1144-20121109/27461_1 /TAXON_ID=483371 /ORGANISM="non described non described, Strain CCMP2298" /LENGTH=374 /DNA_ID=CAMNT_0014323539 /DNA_START=112 /DNA_END=1235 /DNA_ORIENTATION=+
MAEEEAKPSTKEKLASIVQGFDEFDLEMKRGTRLRREKDEFKITEYTTLTNNFRHISDFIVPSLQSSVFIHLHNMAEEEAKPSTKEKLASIVQGFDEFDLEMKRGTRLRREKDEFKITELKNETSRMDTDLTAEIKRRMEMNKSTQIWMEDLLADLNVQFRDALQEKKDDTYVRLDKVQARITNMDTYFEEQKSMILNYIDDTGEKLAKLLYKFKAEFDEDRTQRLDRESVIVKQLTDHEQEVNERFEDQIVRTLTSQIQYTHQIIPLLPAGGIPLTRPNAAEQEVNERFEDQINSREDRYSDVRKVLEDNTKLRDKSEARFSAFFDKELNVLKNDFRTESEIREREDDEIVEALNRYTLKLQTSLKVVNSTDM